MIKVMEIGSKEKKENFATAHSPRLEMGGGDHCRPVDADGDACVDLEIRESPSHKRHGLEMASSAVEL
jgi:hypothetical protein